jgi:DNA-binding NarL/FixJ family response regulator
MATRPRVLAAGDHRLAVGALAKLLATSFDILGTAANRKELLEVAATLKPELVILDREMQDAGDQLRQVSVGSSKGENYLECTWSRSLTFSDEFVSANRVQPPPRGTNAS